MSDLILKVEAVADGVITRAADREPESQEVEQEQGAEPSEDEGDQS